MTRKILASSIKPFFINKTGITLIILILFVNFEMFENFLIFADHPADFSRDGIECQKCFAFQLIHQKFFHI